MQVIQKGLLGVTRGYRGLPRVTAKASYRRSKLQNEGINIDSEAIGKVRLSRAASSGRPKCSPTGPAFCNRRSTDRFYE